jgi:anaerobic selenocysteine-containing dehydrogenase
MTAIRDARARLGEAVRQTTCYMCACRCGIDVHVTGGQVVHIEGNRAHPVNRGVLCAKGSAGVMQHLSPARLRAPLRRTGPRGSGQFEEIGWDEALETAAGWLRPLRERAPERFAFFTGRDQSQSLTGWFAQQFGTPNWAAHGGFCSVNMAAAGLYTLGASFWEFGQPDWARTELLLLFGVAEDHDSNPIKIGLGQLKGRGARVVSVNPVRTGYSAIADDWFGITPGTDGLLILALCHELMRTGRIDLGYLQRFTDAGHLVEARDGAARGLYLRDAEGRPLVRDRRSGAPVPWDAPGVQADLAGGCTIGGVEHLPVFRHLAARLLDPAHSPEAVAGRCGIPAPRIRALAAEIGRVAFDRVVTLPRPWTDFRGQQHATMTGRPVSIHAMRGISAHSNGFQTARALHVLQILIGSVEVPGGWRMKPPYPRPLDAHPRPHGDARPGRPLAGPVLGLPRGPADLLVAGDGTPLRLDKGFSWENPLSVHGLMHMAIPNAHAGDPYRIDTLMLYMTNMAWNSSMNTAAVMAMLTDRDAAGDHVIPRVIVADAFSSEMVAYADLVLPDTTYLERHDCISLLDRPICEADHIADSIRWPVVEPDRPGHAGVRGFQSVLLDLGARLGLPGMVNADGTPRYRDYADYIVNHERHPGIGPLAGWRGADGAGRGRGAPNPAQIERYIANGGFWSDPVPEGAAFFKPWNTAWQEHAVARGLQDAPQPYLFSLWCEPLRRFQLAAEGYGDRQPPDRLRARIRATLDPLPLWYPPFEHAASDAAEYPLHAITQRPMAMYHSWHSQNPWLRQIHGDNPLYLPRAVWAAGGFRDGDWAQVISPHGRITVPVALMEAQNPQTVWTWNAIGKRPGAWALDPAASEATRGFLINHIIHELLPAKGDGHRWANSDPVTGQAAWFDLRVRVERTAPPPDGRAAPAFAAQASPVGLGSGDPLGGTGGFGTGGRG